MSFHPGITPILTLLRLRGREWEGAESSSPGSLSRLPQAHHVLVVALRAIPRLTLLETGLLADTGDRRNRRLMPEESRQVGQDRVFAIFIGQQRLVGRYRPGNTESRIAPQQPAIVLGRIIGVHLVNDLGIGLERAIAMGESFRYEDLVPV